MERFGELAMGARELRVQVDVGNLHVRVDERAGWTLEWSSDDGVEPQVERHGTVIRVRQQAGSLGAAILSGASRSGARPESGNLGALVEEVAAEALRSIGGLLSGPLDVRITVPPGLEVVELRSGHGAVEAEGVHGRLYLGTGVGPIVLRAAGGEARLQSGSGEISVSGYGGDLSVSTGSGDVSLAEVEGQAEVSSGRGAIRIENARSLGGRASSGMGEVRVDGGSVRPLRLHTGLGAVRCAATLAPGAYEMKTGCGEISVALPAASARVDARTGYGQVRSEFPLVQVGRSGPLGFGGMRMVGSIGEGEPQVTVALRTGKGDIDLIALRSEKGDIGLHRSEARTAGYEPATRQSPSERTDSPSAAQPDTPHAHPAQGTPSHQREPALAQAEPAIPGEPGQGHIDPAATPLEAQPRQAVHMNTTLSVLEALARGDITPPEAEDLLARLM